jgi:Protein of unknown function (DUF2809)
MIRKSGHRAAMLNSISNRLRRESGLGTGSIARACLCLSIIVSGLALRRYGFGLGLPAVVVKYGGSVLWAMMVFFLVAIVGSKLPRWRIAMIAAAIAIGVELFRLVHTAWLDEFRLTLAGALLLGRIFSLWDLLAYGAGVILGMALDRFCISAFTTKSPVAEGTG